MNHLCFPQVTYISFRRYVQIIIGENNGLVQKKPVTLSTKITCDIDTKFLRFCKWLLQIHFRE